jgi:thioredoxin-dependent peroxiredoxin
MGNNRFVFLKEKKLILTGDEIKVGQDAPDFKVLNSDIQEKGLLSFGNKVKLIASVPSLDTPICDLEIKRFNDEAANTSKNVVIIFVSMDLPFAQKRFCQAYNIKRVKILSDHREALFGLNYGVLIKELRLLSRAVFVIDKNNRVVYTEYVKELELHPDYQKALNALKKAL